MSLFHYVHVFTCPIPHTSVWKFAWCVVAQQQQQKQQLAEETTDNLFDHFPPTLELTLWAIVTFQSLYKADNASVCQTLTLSHTWG